MTGLRKQVVDLKEAMLARRRVEEALRDAEILLHALIDGAPVGLCLFRCDGTLLAANRPLAVMLGYDSPAELQRVGGALGVFTGPAEQSRVLDSAGPAISHATGQFRHKDGARLSLDILSLRCTSQDTTVLVVFDRTFCSASRNSGPQTY
ncbi:MAG: PAS domain-containing protein [Gemmatimonadales bacterium]